MKIVSMVLGIMLVSSFAFADITSNQGEQKVIEGVKQLYTQLSTTKENATRVYNKIKVYVTDHSAQFSTADKTKLNNLNTKLTTINSAILDFMTQVETDFSGINE